MVAANDEMGAAVVLADQPVPDRLARAGHAHGEVQERHGGRGRRVFVEHRLIAAHAREMVHIAGFGQADDRVDQQVRLCFPGRAEGQFLMRAVQRVARLEGNYAAPAQLAEIGAQFVRGVAAAAEIVMHRLLDAGDRATQIDVASGIVQVVHRRVRLIVGSEDLCRLVRLVRGPAVGHGHGGQDHALLIAQRDILLRFQGLRRRPRRRPA